MKPSGTITAFLLDLLAVLPVETEAEDVSKKTRRLTTKTIMPIYKSLKQYKLRMFCVLSS